MGGYSISKENRKDVELEVEKKKQRRIRWKRGNN